ncbi:hypothetical protein H072_11066 [Dactylellina haptotyla CBS 200.50]|uniref:Het-C-domain-containing protein n=1 Tax=Dactylellina haptotyla (strain CBS 200.50) TaxID=1284197 RepID=S7ZXS7_DACHA|nr:hypothetical protein H072_11066 [Dactylellina haptotyla CBS 200.50]
MFSFSPNATLLALVVLVFCTRPTLAFGAGNVAGVSKVEGVNWRHGDIEDTLLTIVLARAMGGKKFDKLAVSRVYFGNWLRDYSQAIDVGTVKAVSSEAIRLLLCVLGFMTFGFGSKEFEVTADRLGCYRPEDHIDNPKNYADNVDARQYDRRLRGPINERIELAIDEETGMKNYIANEGARIMTSAQHVRNLFSRCIELGRNYSRNRNEADFHEALRLLGTGLHCLEDFLAHSNYTELALIEMGERDVFPHVGSDTMMRLRGARREVYPLVTGTFGGVDFLHSVTGEVSDKLTQNEIEELEGTLQNTSQSDDSKLEDLLNAIPDGLLGGGKDGKKDKMHEIKNNATNSQMENMSVSPRDPEQFTQYVQQVFRQIMPAIEFHDNLMKSISEAIEKIPILPKILEQFEDRMSVWVFSIMAPFVVPIIRQIKNELRTGSNEIIESSRREQHIVFEDDRCTDPTHSMLSKDHFSNVLNEIAGKTASKVVAWVVPQLMEAWDDERCDVDRLLSRIIHGVLHHPAQRDMGEDGARDGRQIMFRSVEEWWRNMDEGAKDEYRGKLSRRGVENGENHKEGVHDSGHGCAGHLGMHKNFAKGGTMEDRIAGMAADALISGVTGGISGFVKTQTGVDLPDASSGGRKYAGEVQQAESGGLGGLLSSIGGSLLGGSFSNEQKESYSSSRRDDDSYTESRKEYGHSEGRYGEAEYSRTQYSGGGQTESYNRYEQKEDRRGTTQRYEEHTESRQTHGGGYEQRTERYESTQESYGGNRRDNEYGGGRSEGYGGGGGGYGNRRDDDEGHGRRRDDDNEGYGRRRDDDNEGYGRRRDDDNEGHGRRRDDDNNEGYGRRHNDDEGGYGGRRQDENEGYGGRRDDNEYGGGYDGDNRRRRNDDDNEERRGGGRGGY